MNNPGLIHPYMLRKKEQIYETESYVSTPPAAFICDERGDVWAIGYIRYAGSWRGQEGASGGEFAFNVLRNGLDMGEFANRIERRGGRVRIYGPAGWKVFNGRTFI